VPKKYHDRIAGIGLALPEDEAELELANNSTIERHEQLQVEIEAALGLEVYLQNDITAAAHAESIFGVAKR
jgi:predicted NBD/HSP70 family sugar kinase